MNSSLAIDDARLPADWVVELKARGITVSERMIREWANKTGNYFRIGRQMLINTDQMNEILQGKKQCPSKYIGEVRPGGRKVGSDTSASQSQNTTGPALDRLRKLAQGDGAKSKKRS